MTYKGKGMNMRIIYIGCVESSYVFLKVLLDEGANIIGVITKKTSSFNSDFKDITPLCKQYNIPYIYTKNSNDDDTYHFIKERRPDLVFCFGWSQLISERIIKIIPNGIVGFHPAELPNNRGRHPIIWALVLGLKSTASSFFMIDKEADTGDIVSQAMVEITENDDAASLMKKILSVGKKQVIELWKDFENGSVIYVPQDKSAGNAWRKRTTIDGQIDWRMSSKSIYNLVRALTKPYAGAHFVFRGNNVKVWKVKEVKSSDFENIEPGKVLAVETDGTILIKAGDNLIRLIDFEQVELKVGAYL